MIWEPPFHQLVSVLRQDVGCDNGTGGAGMGLQRGQESRGPRYRRAVRVNAESREEKGEADARIFNKRGEDGR